ncbi:MAG: signal peptidase I [Candidatus Yanofskybacteria bacterium]|nr:signal peptidase I [Candidatus Yanofskybacteria bacterium]
MTEEFEPQSSQEPKPQTRHEALAFIWETIKIVIISLAIVIPIRYFLVQPFFVKGASMEPTFEDTDYILIDEITYRFRDPARGEVVVFRFPQDQTQFFIKRIIGMPGETVEIKNDQVIIHNKEKPGGFSLNESYLDKGQHTMGGMRIKLNLNEYFVLGDNRLRSSDSRRWGPLNRSLITGRVFFRAWPIDEFGWIPATEY